jgi:hypothetical protein
MKTFYSLSNRRWLLLCTLGLAFLFTFNACRRNTQDEPAPPPATPEQFIQGNWRQTAGVATPVSGGQAINYWLQVQACDADDITVFRGNLTMERNEGATKCSSTAPQVYFTGTYAFNTARTVISITPTGASAPSDVWTITTLNATQLVVTYQVVSQGTTFNVVDTYAKQ